MYLFFSNSVQDTERRLHEQWMALPADAKVKLSGSNYDGINKENITLPYYLRFIYLFISLFSVSKVL